MIIRSLDWDHDASLAPVFRAHLLLSVWSRVRGQFASPCFRYSTRYGGQIDPTWIGYQSILPGSPAYTERMYAMTFQTSSSVSCSPTFGIVASGIWPLMSLYRTSSLLPNFQTSSVSGGPMPPPPPTPWHAEHPYFR